MDSNKFETLHGMAIGHGLFTQVDTLISMLSLNYLKRQHFSPLLTQSILSIFLPTRLLCLYDVTLHWFTATQQKSFIRDIFWGILGSSSLGRDFLWIFLRALNKSSNWFTALRLPYSTKNTNFVFYQSGSNFGDHPEIIAIVMV